MDCDEVIDLHASAVVVGTEKQLVNRLDASIQGVRSVEGRTRRLVGIMARTANTGTIIGRLEQDPRFTIDMALANGATVIIPCDLPIPLGQQLSFFALSTTGTAAVALSALVKRE